MEGQEHLATGVPDVPPEAFVASEASTDPPASHDKPNQGTNLNIQIPSTSPWDSRDNTLPWTPLRLMGPPTSPVLGPHKRFHRSNSRHRGSQTDRIKDLFGRKSNADEGYHSVSGGSHSEGQSVFSSDTTQHLTAPIPVEVLNLDRYNHSIQEASFEYTTQSPQESSLLVCKMEGCQHKSLTPSEFKKHTARHKKVHVCKEPGCPRTEGFATINDLERHRKGVRKLQPEHGQGREYKCFGETCSEAEKVWPRFDNFKQHLKSMHADENIEVLISKSNVWYDKYKEAKAISPILESEDIHEIKTLSTRSDDFHVDRAIGLETQTQPDHLGWETLSTGSGSVSSERTLHCLLGDDKQQHHTSEQGSLRPPHRQAISTIKDSSSEYRTSLSALRTTTFDYSPVIASNPPLQGLQARLEDLQNFANMIPYHTLLPTTENINPFLDHIGRARGFPTPHQDNSPQPHDKLQDPPASSRRKASKCASHIEHTGSSTNSSRTIEDASLDRLRDHESSGASAVGSPSDLSTTWSFSIDKQDTELPVELVPIHETLVEQLIAGYITNWRSSHGHVRSRPGRGSAVSGQGRRQAPCSSQKAAPSAKSLGKRRREPEEDPGDFSNSDDDSKRRRVNSEPDDSAGRLFACPYAKYDPIRYSERNELEANYRGCSSKTLRSIARVKQHLYRVHMQPEQYCPRCGQEFDHQDLFIAHSHEDILCDIRELPFKEKMTIEQRKAVHKRTPGKCPSRVWFEIFAILFPGVPTPSSPYAETGSPEAIQDFLLYFWERAPQMHSTLILQNGLTPSPYEQIMLDVTFEMTISRLVQEYGVNFHRPSADNAQDSNNFALVAEAPMTVSAISEEETAILPQIEAGPSRTGQIITGSTASSLDNHQHAEQLMEFPSYSMDDGFYSDNPGSSSFAGSSNWNDFPQMQVPSARWQPRTWNQSPRQRLQRVAEGA